MEMESVSQTVRILGRDSGGVAGDTWIGFTSLRLRAGEWRLQSSLSWLAWRPAAEAAPDYPAVSGAGAAYLSAERDVMAIGLVAGESPLRISLRARTKLPLQSEASILGSGELDWSAGCAARQRIGRTFLRGELGYLDLGDSPGSENRGVLTLAGNLGFMPRGASWHLLTGILGATSAREGAGAYAEVSLGLGLTLDRHVALSLLGSRGITSSSPGSGLALQMTFWP